MEHKIDETGIEDRSTFDLAKTLRLILILRVVIVTALLGAAGYVHVFYGVTSDSLYFIIGVTYLLTLFYAVLAAPLKNSSGFIFFQLLVDVFLITILVLVTGAIESPFIILYYLIILTAAVTLGKGASISLGMLAGVLFSLVTTLANGGIADLKVFYPYSEPSLNNLIYTIILHLIALLLLAFISGYLAGILQRTARNLRLRTADLRRLQVIHQSIILSTDIGIITTDMDGQIRFCNRAAERLTKRSQNQLIGRDIYSLLEFNTSAPSVIIGSRGWTREMFLVQPNDTRVDVEVNRTFLLGAGKEHDGKLYLISDLREIKELRRQLVVKDRLATAGSMSAAIAHEIRNPLGAISGSAQMIRKSPDLAEDQRYLMDIIVRESERLSNILNNFLTFAKEPVFAPIQVDLVRVSEEIATLMANSDQYRDTHTISFTTRDLAELPAEVDQNLYKQMMYNLISNAAKAMPSGGTILVSLFTREDMACLSVRDSGVGLSPEKAEILFEPFSSKFEGGTGIGLAVVYRIVQQHSGHIHVSSKGGTGTTVVISLPLKHNSNSTFGVTVETE